jgi:hypothetical protein
MTVSGRVTSDVTSDDAATPVTVRHPARHASEIVSTRDGCVSP